MSKFIGPKQWIEIEIQGDWTPNYVTAKIATVNLGSDRHGRVHRDHPKIAEILSGKSVRLNLGESTRLQLL